MIRVWAAAFVGLWVVPGCGPALPGDEATGTTAVETTGAVPTSVVPTSEGTGEGTTDGGRAGRRGRGGARLGVMGGLTITPDGQVVVLEVWPELGEVFATSLRVVDGAMDWRTKVAASDANGSPRAGGALAAVDGTHVIVGQNDEFESLPVTGTVRPLSPGGVLGPVISLDLQQRFGSTVLTPARGPCGEMLVLQLETPGWLGSFAP